MKRLSLLLTVPALLFVVLFFIANRHQVILSFDPFNSVAPALAFAMPLWSIAFGAFLIGILVGGLAAWMARAGRSLQRYAISRAEKRAEAVAMKDPHATLPAIAPALSLGPTSAEDGR